jgi:two-component sensor histidine kinase
MAEALDKVPQTLKPSARDGGLTVRPGLKSRMDLYLRLAAGAMRAERASLYLLKDEQLWLAAGPGLAGGLALAAYAEGAAVLSADLRADRGLAGFGVPGFFAAAPLIGSQGLAFGLLAVHDDAPRPGDALADITPLSDLAALLAQDILTDTWTAREEEQREASLGELDHRVKNVLAAVQSMAAQSARKTVSLDSFLKTFEGRLKAMAAAHELLTATRWRGAAIGDLATAELSGLAAGQARWEGPEFFLSPRAANALSLALHELATNAVKYGALSVETGRVQVIWRELADGGFVLDWKETGGPSVVPPTRHGFGATLLEQVTGRELGGEAVVEFPPDGARVRITADAQARVRRPPDLAVAAAPVAEPEPPIAETLTGASLGGLDGDGGGVAGLRLLIVEDAVLLAVELEEGLQEAGAHVVGSAADLEEALGMLSLEIDAAVLDANLNGKSVAPVAEALKARGTPFVFATGYGDAAAPAGFDAPIVRKPYNVHQIIRALSEVTGRG